MIRVDLCAACAEKLRVIVAERGEDAMGQAAGPVISKCPTCRKQLPTYKLGRSVGKLREREQQILTSRLKRSSSKM